MRKEDLPIEGFCIAAGIPTTEKAVEIVGGLASSTSLSSLTPGSVDGIRQVFNIASANLDFPIIMQWTGGHHLFEDFQFANTPTSLSSAAQALGLRKMFGVPHR